jgi:Xaa-Pro aminopeptidase
LITQDQAGLWTDGRYFLQAEQELFGSGFQLFRSGEDSVPSMEEYLERILQGGECIGFDGRTVSGAFVAELEKRLEDMRVSFYTGLDLIGAIWEERPEIGKEPVWNLDIQFCGVDRLEKLSRVRREMKAKRADVLLLSSLDELAWLLNLRGGDVKYCPVFLAYGVVTQDTCLIFGQKEAFSKRIQAMLSEAKIQLLSYDEIYHYLGGLGKEKLWVDKAKVNYALLQSLSGDVKMFDAPSPIVLLKSVKNQTEIENVRNAHIKDGVAVTKFLYWLDQHVKEGTVTECSGAARLEEFRKEQALYQGASFAPIVAFGEHGAIVHYSGDEKSDVVIKGDGLLLMDTGGHYLDGSTDITRTVVVGAVTQEQRSHYTAVLRGNLKLGAAKFRYGCSGVNLDYLAREALWEQGLDYNHGTGHGIGFLLNVHEGSVSIRWRTGLTLEQTTLEAGMITSNEPGYYQAGAYGIRLENLLLCCEGKTTEYGQFMEFETLTVVPFDRRCILVEMLDAKERQLLNAYHQKVYETLAPYLDTKERLWLENVTAMM